MIKSSNSGGDFKGKGVKLRGACKLSLSTVISRVHHQANSCFTAKPAHTGRAHPKATGNQPNFAASVIGPFSVKFKLPNEKQFLTEAVKNNFIGEVVFAGQRQLL